MEVNTPIIINGNAVVEKVWVDENTGKNCVVALNTLGYRLGYVEINKRVPFDILNDEDVFLDNFVRVPYKDKISNVAILANTLSKRRSTRVLDKCILVHGGVTFLGIKDVTSDISMRAIGFDCAHLFDTPDKESLANYFGKDSIQFNIVNKNCKEEGKIWSIEDTAEECESLARQVVSIENKYLRMQKINRKKAWKEKRKSGR